MAISKKISDLVDILEKKRVVVLPKEPPLAAPTIRVTSAPPAKPTIRVTSAPPAKPTIRVTSAPPAAPPTKAPAKAKEIINLPDIGKTATPDYSTIEKVVQNAEFLDSIISNTGFAADMVAKMPLSTKLKYATTALSKGAKAFTPVQMALWGADSVRTVADPRYREQSKKGLKQILEKDSSSPVKASAKAVLSGLARPVSAAQALLDTKSEMDTEAINQSLKSKSIERRLKQLLQDQDDRDVPEITPDTIKKLREVKYFTSPTK